VTSARTSGSPAGHHVRPAGRVAGDRPQDAGDERPELIQAAKRATPGIGSVLITAYASTETAVSALRHGADDYLMKPFGLEDLRRVVERVLTERRSDSRDTVALHQVRTENETLRRARRDTEDALLSAQHDLSSRDATSSAASATSSS
jgi:DNA-binding NtrC family response regulator